jgi:hypothetical protein
LHSYHTISKGRTPSKTAGIDVELDFELDLVYNNFWATTLDLEACHYCNNLQENIRVWGRHIISSSYSIAQNGFLRHHASLFLCFLSLGTTEKKDFFGLGYCMGEHPETSVIPV